MLLQVQAVEHVLICRLQPAEGILRRHKHYINKTALRIGERYQPIVLWEGLTILLNRRSAYQIYGATFHTIDFNFFRLAGRAQTLI